MLTIVRRAQRRARRQAASPQSDELRTCARYPRHMFDASPDGQIIFVIRMWLEPSNAGAAQRGYIEHLASRQRLYFSDVSEALDFAAKLGARRAPPTTSTPRDAAVE